MTARLHGIPPQKLVPIYAADQLSKSYTAAETTAPEPLPTPYAAATVSPESVGIKDGPEIQFLMFGDCGGIEDPAPQKLVAAAIQQLRESGAIDPAFALLVGDGVYFNGDPAQWVPQFYEPYCTALGGVPIIMFPGNHDGDSSDGVTGSGIASFMANMCTAFPEAPPGDPQLEYQRHTQTLPYCDWCLELEALTIIAAWSNVPSGGDLTEDQIGFITDSLKDAPGDVPVMLGLHHPPFSVDAFHGGSAKMAQIIEQCAVDAGRCPDIVVGGHVHDQQRFTWTVAKGWTIPTIVSGNGGYHNTHEFASDVTYPMAVAEGVTFEAGDDTNFGFNILTLGGGKVAGEYVSVAKETGTITRNADTFTTAS